MSGHAHQLTIAGETPLASPSALISRPLTGCDLARRAIPSAWLIAADDKSMSILWHLVEQAEG